MAEQVEAKSSEELGLIMAAQYEQIAACQANIRNIANELNQRQQKHLAQEKRLSNDDTENK